MPQTLAEMFAELFGRPPRPGELEHPYYIAQLRRFGAGNGMFTPEQLAQSGVLMAFPHIMDKEGNLYYGGDQGWYAESVAAPRRSIESFSGCGVVSATDVLATFAYGDEALARRLEIKFYLDGSLAKADFVRLMKSAYHDIGTLELPLYARRYRGGSYKYEERNKQAAERRKAGKKAPVPVPPSLGVWGRRYVKGTVTLAGKYGLQLAAHAIPTLYAGYDEGLRFIKAGIAAGSCVDIFTTFNAHPMTVYRKGYGIVAQARTQQNDQHHVVAVAAHDLPDQDDCEIIVSTWGKLASISYRALHASWQSRKAAASGLYYFTATNSVRKSKDSLRKGRGEVFVSIKRLIAQPFRKKAKPAETKEERDETQNDTPG